MTPAPEPQHLDAVVVGAGLSGIGAAATLLKRTPGLRLAVLESRNAIGGTWDLFRYPGVRSDSDMYTFGYASRPWGGERALAAGDDIRDYVRATARDTGVAGLVEFRQRVTAASWSSTTARWTLTVVQRDPAATGEWSVHETGGSTRTLTCSFLVACTGYYRYDAGHTPAIAGLDAFAGPVVHPQHWPADLDVTGRRVVVVGSGATAVTLVPALAKRGAQVTMLQRSPTWVAAVPSKDHLAMRLRGRVPARLAHRVVRAKHVVQSRVIYRHARRDPEDTAGRLLAAATAMLPAGYDVERHFHPRYDPWDQRLCAVPSGDLFRAISAGTAEVVTDRIERVDEHGVRLESGGRIDADVLVTATGLEVLMLGGMTLTVDGRAVDPGATVAWRGMMLAGVPNLAYVLGYVNSSWTLRSDLVARVVARLVARTRRGAVVVPDAPPDGAGEARVIDLAAGYVRRGAHLMPRQGDREPWLVHQDYLRELALFRLTPLSRGLTTRTAPDGRSAA